MEDIDLYKLPKDILVKLLATIRRDVEISLEEKYKQQIQELKRKEEILEEIKDDLDERDIFYNYEICQHENCPHYMIENDHHIIYSTAVMFSCQGCGVEYCSSHSSLHLGDDMICSNCFGFQPNPQVEEPIDAVPIPKEEKEEKEEKDDDECKLCGNNGISVIALDKFPNIYYSVLHGYIIRMKDESFLVLGIIEPAKYTIYEILEEKDWQNLAEDLTEEQEKEARCHGFECIT